MTSNSEARKRQEEAARLQCDHIVGTDLGSYMYLSNNFPKSVWDFAYCPKCGEKL